jgi:hypothetical protein
MTTACYLIWSAIPPNEVGRGIRLPDLEKKWHRQADFLISRPLLADFIWSVSPTPQRVSGSELPDT